jgi:hypothetical protein
MSQTTFVAHALAASAISLLNAPITVDCEDFEGIHIAATTLAQDIARVTDGKAPTITSEQTASQHVIIIGSVQRSRLIHQLTSAGKINPNAIEKEWETCCTELVEAPWAGCAKALVIYGSDKRGTIFGIYSLSEQIGVSP